MTDAFSYYGEPQIQPIEIPDQWPAERKPSASCCVLTRHDMLRVVRESGLRELAVLAVIKQHGDCFASPWTIARESGCRDVDTVKGYIANLTRIASAERVTVRGREILRAVASDGPSKPFVLVSKAWMERYVESCDLWSVGSKAIWKRGSRKHGRRPKVDNSIAPRLTPTAAAVLWLMQSRGRTFNATASELAAECGLSRDQFLEIARLLRDCGQIRFRRSGNGTVWTTDCDVPKLSEKSCDAPARLSEKSCQELDVKQKQLDVDLKTGTESEKQEARRAKIGACEPPSHPNSSRLEDHDHDGCECIDGWLYVTDSKGHTGMRRCERWLRWQKRQIAERDAANRHSHEPPDFRHLLPPLPPPALPEPEPRPQATPSWSKATSMSQQVIRNVMLPDGRYALQALHYIVCDCFGMYDDENDDSDFSDRTWKRINGMLRRMPHRTVDEFRDAMTEAAEQLEEQRNKHPGGSFYFDFEKGVLWAVGRATGCSYWVD